MQHFSGNQRPDLLTSLINIFCTAPATENTSMQILFKCPTPAIVFGNATKPSRSAHFWQGLQSLAPATRRHIWTSKSGPNPWCFLHFDFEMFFAPPRRPLFRHLNFQKWSERAVFLPFSLANVLRATTACTFSTSQLPKVVRTCRAFTFFTCKCASCHNSVHFFGIATSKSGPNVRCFLAFSLANVLRATTACTFSTSQLPKVVRTCRAFTFFTCKCASCHNSVHFFGIANSKSGPNVRCFLAFSLANVLRATTACTFSTSQLPKVVRTCRAFTFFTCKCASCHNSVHFFGIATSKSGPNVRCFLAFSLANVLRATTACNFSSLIWSDGSAPSALASLLFDPLERQIIGKTKHFATFLPFRASAASSFFWLFLFSDLLSSTRLFSLTLPISAFHLSILSEVWLLNFLRLVKTGGPRLCPHFEAIWISTCAEVAPTWVQVGAKLRHLGAKLGRSWSQLVQIGLKLGPCWPQVGPMLRPCWIETVHLDDVGLIIYKCTSVPCIFWRLARANMPPPAEAYQSDRSVGITRC